MSAVKKIKRLCLIRHRYYPGDSRVRKEVSALLGDGWEVDIICVQDKNEKRLEKEYGLAVYRIPIGHSRSSQLKSAAEYIIFSFCVYIMLSVLFWRRRYDVIQVNTMPDILVFTALVPKLFGASIILDMYELMPELYMSVFSVGGKHPVVRLLRLMESWSIKVADHLIVVNEQCKKILQTRSVASDKMLVLLNAPDDSIFHPNNNSKTRSVRNGLNILTHGSILERYGHKTLIKAFSILKSEIPNASLDILGDGEYRNDLEKLTIALELSDCICFHGMVSLEKVKLFIEKADVCIVTLSKDIYADITLPCKLFEYMALNKPIVSSNIAAVKEYFGKGEVAFFASGDEIDLAKAIRKVYLDSALRKEMIEKAALSYQNHSWSLQKRQYLKLVNGYTEDVEE